MSSSKGPPPESCSVAVELRAATANSSETQYSCPPNASLWGFSTNLTASGIHFLSLSLGQSQEPFVAFCRAMIKKVTMAIGCVSIKRVSS
jgi:hypothetical protein